MPRGSAAWSWAWTPGTEKQFGGGKCEGGERAERDERVHVGAANPGPPGGTFEKRPATPELDRDREGGRQPPGRLGVGPGVGDDQHHEGERPGDDQAPPPSGLLGQLGSLVSVVRTLDGVNSGRGAVWRPGSVVGGRGRKLVARPLDRFAQRSDGVAGAGEDLDGGPAGGQVDRRRDNRGLAEEDALHPGRARPAGHPGHRELEVSRRYLGRGHRSHPARRRGAFPRLPEYRRWLWASWSPCDLGTGDSESGNTYKIGTRGRAADSSG